MPVARPEEVERFALVMVHPTREEDGSLTHILHTLLPEERPIEVRGSVGATSPGPCWLLCLCLISKSKPPYQTLTRTPPPFLSYTAAGGGSAGALRPSV